uniref:helix-turn-helix domain-containing protein n=1 Tax=Nocardia suismassiliense TaxID=2077092 RepID=UPI003F493455
MTAWLQHPADEDPPDSAGQVVREYRLAANRRQTDVAEAMGMTQQYLSQIEKNSRHLTIETRRRFVEVLGIPPEELGLVRHGRATSDDQTSAVIVSQGRWRTQRHWLNRHRDALARSAVNWYPPEVRVPRTSLIAAPSWMPDSPVEIDSIAMHLTETPQAATVTGREVASLPVRPMRTPDLHFDRYTAAIRHLDPPRLFESRPSYRLTGGSIASGALEFGLAAYFDKLDVSEALGHEIAVACMAGIPSDPHSLRLPLRELISDPFDPTQRAIIPAITTLTIRLRRYPAAPSFLLHWRDPAKVATAAGVYDVVPAGEFQPSSIALWDRVNDFSLWRNMIREYSEELLGAPEHDGTRTEPIDYNNWDLYQKLTDARRSGHVTATVLGMGLDALTLAATILTVVVIDDDVFNDVFGHTVRFNDEGEIVGVGNGKSADGVPFNEESVRRLLETEPLAAPGAAALALAWANRDSLIN